MVVSFTDPLVMVSRIPLSCLMRQLRAFQWYFESEMVSYCISDAVMWLTSFLSSNLSRQKP